MNERIRELAEQAGFETNEANITIGNYFRDKEYFYADDFIEDELKKFAELIMQECAELCEGEAIFAGSNGRKDASASNCATIIRKHFGVEE
jgi:hypothetical protein